MLTSLYRLLALAVATTTLALPVPAGAQDFPDRAIHLVVPYPPGGTADILARLLAQRLAERVGKPVVVDNRAGAGTAIGSKFVAQAAPDGYTLLMGTVSSHAMNPALNRGVGYDPLKDFTPISRVASVPFVVLENPSVPAKTMGELIALAKARPGQITYASAGAGTSNHLAGELLAKAANIQLLHVPYKGSAPALADLLGGQVNLMFDLQVTAKAQIQAGTVRALAVTGAHRSSLLPGLPTVAESGVQGFDVTAWFGIFGPAAMPAPVVDVLNRHLVAVLKSPEVRQQFTAQGAEIEWSSPEAFNIFVQSEYTKWDGLVQSKHLAAQ
ncbi:Bug family tripartite tricarboxylate transporter substrate binding protein [Cupriavidus sp. D39]|uniref:Bug family tripartite tricarboxylate transporter substrate binding protein n=1 Tax=Cupriavidus sp. D39 TaxID=2997877 RepID=UPI002270A009|nr:tripartite tricarboxylate transporter substrate binding protein [Cupriavidus sp. D39]MCY0854154.1 tripartite tricarboxylate transporter substrate binding protein [Cupriavidus sp. D39]